VNTENKTAGTFSVPAVAMQSERLAFEVTGKVTMVSSLPLLMMGWRGKTATPDSAGASISP
jgi:hypothetical protein